MNKKKIYTLIIIGCGILNMSIPLYFYFQTPTELRITEEKGYTIANQEPYPITLAIPENTLTEAAYTEEGQVFSPVVNVYKEENTMIGLTYVQLSEDSEDELYYEFLVLNDLEKSGSIITPYWVREDGKLVWNSFINDDLNTTDLVVNGVSYSDAVSMRSGGPQSNFVLRIKKDVCDLKGSKIEIPVIANKLFYAKGKTTNEPEIYSEEKIIRILKSYQTFDSIIIDCVLVPESKYSIIGVVLYEDLSSQDGTYGIAFVKADDVPSVIYKIMEKHARMYNLEYIGNDAITYVTEIQQGELKRSIKEQITLEKSKEGGTNFITEIVEQ